MLKKISLRWRLTILSSLLIAICCIGLSIVLNISAFFMVDEIVAIPMMPAQSTDMGVLDDTMYDSQLQQSATLSSEEAMKVKNDYFSGSIIYTVIAVLFGGILTYYVSGKALEPVKKLNEQIKNVNAHNLDESLEVPTTKDELAELTVSFNEMTDKLAKSFMMQKRFSADAAHELRTPLAVLQTKLDVFKKRKSTHRKNMKHLQLHFKNRSVDYEML